MKFSSLSLSLVCALLLIAAACSGDDDGEPTATATVGLTVAASPPGEATATQPPTSIPGSPTTPPTAEATPGAGSGIEALSLVYVDTRRGRGAEVFVAGHDGAGPRLVTTDTAFSRPLDVRGRWLASVGTGGVLLIDLITGEPVNVNEANIVFDGRFLDGDTFLYSAVGSCVQGGGVLYLVDLVTEQATALIESEQSLTIAAIDAAAGTLTLLPRGCDPAVTALEVYDAATGALRNSLAVEGCGWAVALPPHNKAVVSWQACTPPEAHAGSDATVYDFGIVGPTGHDVTAPDDGANAHIWLPNPAAATVALGTTRSEGSGPGSTRGGGLYLLDLTDRRFTRIVDAEGAEQYPIAWSPDGRFLLYGIVEAQGLCHFAYVDTQATPPQTTPINQDITFCGLNGHVVGWTALP